MVKSKVSVAQLRNDAVEIDRKLRAFADACDELAGGLDPLTATTVATARECAEAARRQLAPVRVLDRIETAEVRS